MPSTFNAVRRAAAAAAAATNAEYERYLASAEQPGPSVKVQPFEPGSVTPGAAVAKFATSIFSAARERARYDVARKQAQEKIAYDAEDRALRRRNTLLDVAKKEAEASQPPERMIDVTYGPSGEVIPPAERDALVGPPEPGTETVPVAASKYGAALQASRGIGFREQAGVRAEEAGVLAERRAGFAERNAQRSDERLQIYREHVTEQRDKAKQRQYEFNLTPRENSDLHRVRDQALYNEIPKQAASAILKQTYLGTVLDGRAAKDPESFATSLMSYPELVGDPELFDSAVKALGAVEAGPMFEAYISAHRAAVTARGASGNRR